MSFWIKTMNFVCEYHIDTIKEEGYFGYGFD